MADCDERHLLTVSRIIAKTASTQNSRRLRRCTSDKSSGVTCDLRRDKRIQYEHPIYTPCSRSSQFQRPIEIDADSTPWRHAYFDCSPPGHRFYYCSR